MATAFMVWLVFSWWALVFLKHPLELSGFLMGTGIVNSLYLSVGVSCYMGFALFITMVGGVLVLISFCVALVPYSKRSNVSWMSGIRQPVKLSLFRTISRPRFWAIVFLLVGILFISDPLSGIFWEKDFSLRVCEGFLFYQQWAVLIVLLSCYIMGAVIVSISISSKYTGALVSKSWLKPVKAEREDLDSFVEMWKIWRVYK
uniref:NADH dehydrogenase subunit 6 n=1 Tax=Nototeredo knoxi TaxID=2939324 RepID=UPI002028EB95|nr:NADH dehydrogenase subunit 6 [Nototeredo knoxi]UPX89280.1 NADH dehydrogenase subunit 6 [Nototeredo knoxi]